MIRLVIIYTCIFLMYLVFDCNSAPVSISNGTQSNNGTETEDENSVDDANAWNYFAQYGYVGEGELRTKDSMEEKIKEFQKFAGINETGKLDNATQEAMDWSRCGNKDIISTEAEELEIHFRRKKRYALHGSMWPVYTRPLILTYQISKYPYTWYLSNRAVVDHEIARAMRLWSNSCGVRFKRVYDNSADIDIKFTRRDHGDGTPFDGRGGVIAHAFFPKWGGDIHLDNDENFRYNSSAGTDLFFVVAHELGHTLGLKHSSVKDSLMAPFYRGYNPHLTLHDDDILGCQALYGPPHSTAPPAPPTTKTPPYVPPTRPSRCSLRRVNGAVTVGQDTFIFSGRHYWKVQPQSAVYHGPYTIIWDWQNLTSSIDAAMNAFDSQGSLYFFKGSSYWRFEGKRAMPGYPKKLGTEGFYGLPPGPISAAFVWSGNMIPYFIIGNQYYRMTMFGETLEDSFVSSNYPRPTNVWNGIPNPPDSAIQWLNGKTYFFKGLNYYRFNDYSFSTDNGYPRSTPSVWLGCHLGNLGTNRNEDIDI